ncbi:unnamed protein product [Macrosiphum euphorbiae]|uniref:Uncharacterized protein n=1 Tax=Macrosiphum euphorbiae TaxID=13131 RepID=A0AAV0WTJ5_9HEMI|nr:unnamed protein product [Macrosiphum euphorbiae]
MPTQTTTTSTNVAYNGFVNTDEVPPPPQRERPPVVGGRQSKERVRVCLCVKISVGGEGGKPAAAVGGSISAGDGARPGGERSHSRLPATPSDTPEGDGHRPELPHRQPTRNHHPRFHRPSAKSFPVGAW